MNIKTGILGAAAALTLALPAAALAQPYYGGYGDAPRYAERDYRAGDYRRDDWRREEWRRERRREEERRLRWEREHRYGYRYDGGYYGR